MTRYVVVASCDSETSIHGSFRSLERAEAAAAHLNREFDGYDSGVALVMPVLPATRKALRHALTEETR